MTKLINIKSNKKYDIYIGRPSIFGNPFRISLDGTREEVIEKYKNYFYKRLEKDKDFKEKVLALKDQTLGCYCCPEKCHGDIIIEYLDRDENEMFIK